MAKQLRQARAVVRAARDYLRYDLPEIIFPSSLPNPPGYVPEAAQRRDYLAVSPAWGGIPKWMGPRGRQLTSRASHKEDQSG